MTAAFVKDPDAVLDYEVDWSAWLAEGETITTSTWIVPDGLTKTVDANTDTTATVWLSGGGAFTAYPVTNRVVTNQGRTDDRTITIDVQER